MYLGELRTVPFLQHNGNFCPCAGLASPVRLNHLPDLGTLVSMSAPLTASNVLQESFIKLEQAEQFRKLGKLDRARAICESLVRQFPDYMGALHTLGLIYADKNNYQRAFDLLARAAMLNPRSWTTLTALSGVCLRLGAPEMAAQTLEQARAIKPQDANILVTLGEIYLEEREYELARDAYHQAMALEQNLTPAAFGFGTSCSQLGEYAKAAEVFEGLIKRGMPFLDPIMMLAGLPKSLVKIDLLSQLDKVVKSPNEDKTEFENSVAFARAVALDRADRYAEAWEHLVRANQTLFLNMKEELREEAETQRASLAWLRVNSVRTADTKRSDSGQPISLFILGPSRSGKTSMEQLVSALQGVKRGYENPNVENAVRRAMQTAGLLTSNRFENLPAQLYALCRDIYFEELARRAGSAKVFTNTHPGRIIDAAYIASAFPNVRFICVRRELEDNILRIYMRKYKRGNAYAYDPKSTRDYVVWYNQMIDLLVEKLPDVRVMQYEDMIAEPAAALRTVAELCDLPMTDKPLPTVGDDRGCAEPYREFMAAALAG